MILNCKISEILSCLNTSSKKPTCCKGHTPTGTDHVITNIPNRFMKSMALETGISGHHKMIMTIFCSTFAKV